MKLVDALKMRWVVWVWKHTPNCAEMARLASQSFEYPPSLGMQLRMRLHYLICIWCERYAKHLGFLHGAAPQLDAALDNVAGRRLSDDAKKRMVARLNEADHP